MSFSSLCFSTKYPKIDGNDEKLASIFGIERLATQTNSKSGGDVSQMIEPESLKSAGKTDIQLEKDHKLHGLCREISNLSKVSSVFNVCFSILYNTS